MPLDDVDAAKSSTGGSGALEAERMLAGNEHAADVIRLRRSLTVGAILWPAFLIVDWLMISYVSPQSPWPFIGLRGLETAVLVGAVWRLGQPNRPSEHLVRALDIACFSGAALTVAIMCLQLGGITSPYAAGIPVVLVCRGAFVAEHWRDGLFPVGVTASMYPIVMFAAAAVSPGFAAQFRDPAALAVLGLFMALILATVAFSLVGSHARWALRRLVFESRGIGQYRLRQRIGRGGMGEVWLARRAGLDRDVAIKILRSERHQDPTTLRRFEREVQATTALTHPNTVRIFDYGVTEDGVWYYVMELLDGATLADLVRRKGALPPDLATHIAHQACRALAEAHARGIVHRDVKPANIFVTRTYEDPNFVKVLDFGIAKIMSSDTAPTLTQTGWIGGTPTYMSPEAARGDDTDARSDVYAMGAVLYYALTSTPPFGDANHAAIMMAQVHREPEPPSARLGRALPHGLEDIVLRCLAKDPAQRYSDAGELAAVLERWQSAT